MRPRLSRPHQCYGISNHGPGAYAPNPQGGSMHPRLLMRRRPSAPLVVSVIALFVALGGVGYAATFLPANSVGTAQLQNNAVKNWKISNQAVGNWKLAFGAVGSRKIENGAVGTKQINSNQVQARVAGTCSSPGKAIAAIAQKG